MKLVILPAYRGEGYTETHKHWRLRELLADMEKKGQLEGVEIDIDEGYPFPSDWQWYPVFTGKGPQRRPEQFFAYINLGITRKVAELSEMGKYDGIVQDGDLDPGFFNARFVSKIPFVSSTHAAVHVASLIGERSCLLAMTHWGALTLRRTVQSYGFNHKVVSVRPWRLSGIGRMESVPGAKKEERIKMPEVERSINDLAGQCIAAIEKEGVDSLILGCLEMAIFADDVRHELDKAGYNEIPIITSFSASVEMAKVMVNMKLTQAPRAYCSPTLKAPPEFR